MFENFARKSWFLLEIFNILEKTEGRRLLLDRIFAKKSRRTVEENPGVHTNLNLNDIYSSLLI